MSSVTFDTLRFVERLRDAGLSEPQAKAIAEALREATSDELVTRSYFDAKLAELKGGFRAGQLDRVKWFAGLLIAQAAVVAALVKLL